jgi:hypothetical protein
MDTPRRDFAASAAFRMSPMELPYYGLDRYAVASPHTSAGAGRSTAH